MSRFDVRRQSLDAGETGTTVPLVYSDATTCMSSYVDVCKNTKHLCASQERTLDTLRTTFQFPMNPDSATVVHLQRMRRVRPTSDQGDGDGDGDDSDATPPRLRMEDFDNPDDLDETARRYLQN